MINAFFPLQPYGVDWDGPLSPEENAIEIPDTRCPVSNSDYALLIREVSPINDTTTHGIDLYERTVQFVTSSIQR